MGVREIERSLERWELGVKDLQRRMILAPTPRERALRQAQELVGHAAASPRVDSGGHGRGTGPRPSRHRTVGIGLR